MKNDQKKREKIQSQKRSTKLRAHREKRGVSLRRVAEFYGVSAPYLSELERGRYNLTETRYTSLIVICDVLSQRKEAA